MTVQLTSRPQIPGGYVASSETTDNIRYLYMAKQEAFSVSVNGLIPLTRHFVFFEGNKVSAQNIKPLNGKAGDSLYTDENGRCSFVFYYTSPLISSSSEQLYNEIAQRIGGDKQLVVASTPSTVNTLPTNFVSSYNSVAVKNIFFKTSKVSELPIKTNYAFAYPPEPEPANDDGGGYDGGGSNIND